MHSSPSTPLHAHLIVGILVLAAAITASPAAIVSLDFEEPPVPTTGTQIGINEYTEDGFYIKPLGPVDADPPFRLRRNGGSTATFPENGSPYLQLALGDSFEMVQLSASPFTPISIDLAEYSDLFSGVEIAVTFTGIFADTSTVSTTFTTDGVIDGTGALVDFETFLFPSSFTSIIRLEVAEASLPTDSFSLDALVVNNVPEPSRVLLFTLALTLSILQRRRAHPRNRT